MRQNSAIYFTVETGRQVGIRKMEPLEKRPTLPRIVKVSAEVRATEALRTQIVEGLLAPGSRVTEVQLSDEMGLSRATIRAALHELAKEGLLTLVPYTGWTVIELTKEDVWELYTLRSAVERLAAQLAARATGGNQHTLISVALDKLAQECARCDPAGIANADFSFHKAIVDAASHRRLSAQYALIEQQIRSLHSGQRRPCRRSGRDHRPAPTYVRCHPSR